MNKKINISIFISGTGSNARNIIQYFKNHEYINISLIISNNSQSGALQISKDTGVPFYIVRKNDFYQEKEFMDVLSTFQIKGIVLAGFLWLIPRFLIQRYPNRIINIHPSLLPKYGGKGMYGMHVHKAVKENGEKKSGITIHVVNEEYDKGEILLQKEILITENDTPDQIAEKVHQLEYQYFPSVIEDFFSKEFQFR